MTIYINNYYSNNTDKFNFNDFKNQIEFMKFYESFINNDLVWDNYMLLTYNHPYDWHFCLSDKINLYFDFIEKIKTFKLIIKVNSEILITTLPNHFTIKDIREKYNFTSTQKNFYHKNIIINDDDNIKELIGNVNIDTISYSI